MTEKKQVHRTHPHTAPPKPIWTNPRVLLSVAILIGVVACLVYGCPQAKAADVRVNAGRSTVRIATDDGAIAGKQIWGFGSGVVVKRANRVRVVTAAHVVRHARRIWVGVNGVWVPARPVRVDAKWDLGALNAKEAEGLVALELAPGVRIGERVTSAGFGSGNFQTRPGMVQQWFAPAGGEAWESMIVSGPARQGDSGGPMIDDNGNLAGILQATDGRTTYGTTACRVAKFLDEIPDNASHSMVPMHFASLPAGYAPTAVTPGGKKREAYQKRVISGLDSIQSNTARQPMLPTPAVPVPMPAGPDPAAQEALRLGQENAAKIDALAEQLKAKAEEDAKPTGLKGKIHEKLESDAEEGGLKGKVAETLLRWEERGKMGVWAAIVAAIAFAVYWHKNKHGPVAGVLERMGKPELAEREQAIVERVEARIKGVVATAATGNPAIGLAVTEAEKVEARIKDYLAARLAPAPGQPGAATGTTPPAVP